MRRKEKIPVGSGRKGYREETRLDLEEETRLELEERCGNIPERMMNS